MTSEVFTRLIISDAVVNRISEYRRRLPELEELKRQVKEKEALLEANPDPKLPMNTELKGEIRQLQAKCREITSIKSGLPVIIYQATFNETVSKKGYKGRWRKQSAARLNGLFMLDVDHVDAHPLPLPKGGVIEHPTPRDYYKLWRESMPELFSDNSHPSSGEGKGVGSILLIHITPSGRGLRIVAIADANVGNLADNQAWLAEKLGVQPDEACKDASRCSFCPSFNDLIYIDNENIFTYENPEYDKTFGAQYRSNNSQPTMPHAASGPDSIRPVSIRPHVGAVEAVASGGVAEREDPAGSGQAEQLDIRLKAGYHGKSFNDICDSWFRVVQGGVPQAGDRHQSLYRMACDLRYITDFDAKLLARVLAESAVGKDIASERGMAEIERIATDACALQRWRSIPKRFQKVLEALGIQLDGRTADETGVKVPAIDYAAWYARLEPLLSDSPGYREAVAPLPNEHKMAGVLAAGAMFGTYLTRCWWEHFDGKDYRLSFLVYIIGGAASGKSAIPQMDALIMAPMMAADRVGREWERQYKEEMKKRAASTKNAKAEAPEQQHPVIRYVPSTISNAMLYRRLTDAVDQNTMGPDGQPIHLHCYTCEAELATALRAQQGSWAGKLDLECKSFQNEVAGVDYANDQSVNGIIQVNWNQVITGTPDAMSRKIRPSTVLDGLVTRMVLFPMPENDFAMIERRRAYRDHERECFLRMQGVWLEQVKGELKADRLVDFCFEYEKQLAREAKLEEDRCLDYFRKRIPLIMMRYTLVRMVLRQKERALKGEEMEITDSDIEFARLIGDWCLMAQMHFFGQQVMDAMEREREAFTPRKRSRKVREAYACLPELITQEVLVENSVAGNLKYGNKILLRWLEDGLVERLADKKTYRKKYKEIPE